MQILDLEATWQESEPRTPLVCLLSIGSDPTTQIGQLAKQNGIGKECNLHFRVVFTGFPITITITIEKYRVESTQCECNLKTVRSWSGIFHSLYEWEVLDCCVLGVPDRVTGHFASIGHMGIVERGVYVVPLVRQYFRILGRQVA